MASTKVAAAQSSVERVAPASRIGKKKPKKGGKLKENETFSSLAAEDKEWVLEVYGKSDLEQKFNESRKSAEAEGVGLLDDGMCCNTHQRIDRVRQMAQWLKELPGEQQEQARKVLNAEAEDLNLPAPLIEEVKAFSDGKGELSNKYWDAKGKECNERWPDNYDEFNLAGDGVPETLEQDNIPSFVGPICEADDVQDLLRALLKDPTNKKHAQDLAARVNGQIESKAKEVNDKRDLTFDYEYLREEYMLLCSQHYYALQLPDADKPVGNEIVKEGEATLKQKLQQNGYPDVWFKIYVECCTETLAQCQMTGVAPFPKVGTKQSFDNLVSEHAKVPDQGGVSSTIPPPSTVEAEVTTSEYVSPATETRTTNLKPTAADVAGLTRFKNQNPKTVKEAGKEKSIEGFIRLGENRNQLLIRMNDEGTAFCELVAATTFRGKLEAYKNTGEAFQVKPLARSAATEILKSRSFDNFVWKCFAWQRRDPEMAPFMKTAPRQLIVGCFAQVENKVDPYSEYYTFSYSDVLRQWGNEVKGNLEIEFEKQGLTMPRPPKEINATYQRPTARAAKVNQTSSSPLAESRQESTTSAVTEKPRPNVTEQIQGGVDNTTRSTIQSKVPAIDKTTTTDSNKKTSASDTTQNTQNELNELKASMSKLQAMMAELLAKQ